MNSEKILIEPMGGEDGGIFIAEIGGEGGGARVYARQLGGTLVFWHESSQLDINEDDDEVWLQFRSEPVSDLADALPLWWANAYPLEINPLFTSWFRERYEQHCKDVSAFPEDAYRSPRDRWLEILYENQKM
jgi:hypothetical protein